MEKLKRIMPFFLYEVLGVYIILLVWLVFFDRGTMRSINLIPFVEWIEMVQDSSGQGMRDFRYNVFGNIMMFIPAGIYFTLFMKNKKISVNLFWIFLTSLSIEVIQFIFALGISDINDIIANCLGGLIGILIYKLAEKIFKSEEKVRSAITILSTVAGISVVLLLLVLVIYNWGNNSIME